MMLEEVDTEVECVLLVYVFLFQNLFAAKKIVFEEVDLADASNADKKAHMRTIAPTVRTSVIS